MAKRTVPMPVKPAETVGLTKAEDPDDVEEYEEEDEYEETNKDDDLPWWAYPLIAFTVVLFVWGIVSIATAIHNAVYGSSSHHSSSSSQSPYENQDSSAVYLQNDPNSSDYGYYQESLPQEPQVDSTTTGIENGLVCSTIVSSTSDTEVTTEDLQLSVTTLQATKLKVGSKYTITYKVTKYSDGSEDTTLVKAAPLKAKVTQGDIDNCASSQSDNPSAYDPGYGPDN